MRLANAAIKLLYVIATKKKKRFKTNGIALDFVHVQQGVVQAKLNELFQCQG